MYPFNYPMPQGANVDIYESPSSTSENKFTETWVKPPNIGMVWITAIGAGGGGGTGSGDGTFFGYGGGGGSGAIVNVMFPAIFCPPELKIQVGLGGSQTTNPQTPTSTIVAAVFGNTPLVTAASGGNGSNATGSGSTANGAGGAAGSAAGSSVSTFLAPFCISRITAGAAGTTGSAAQSLSTTTCIIGGASGSADSYNGQYGYQVNDATNAVAGSLTYPPLQSFGGNRRRYDVSSASNTARYRAPNGAGGGGGGSRQVTPSCPGHQGGNGLVVIVSW